MRSRAFLLSIVVATSLTLTGCAQISDLLASPQETRTPVAAPSPTSTTPPFESQFTYDGSVSLSTDAADALEVRLDVWASDPKRTSEWTPDNEKTLGFAVNVYDHRVDEKAVLTEKRRVYISDIDVTSKTVSAQTAPQSPFQFSADPRTLVPTDTLRNDRGLLLNSYQGGLLVPRTTILQLPSDTYGITLTFAMTVWIEGSANDENSFTQQVIYQELPIQVFPQAEAAATSP